jgi:hypothetical protein
VRILRSQLFQQAGSFAQRMKPSSIQWSASWLAAKEGNLNCQPEHRAHPVAIQIIDSHGSPFGLTFGSLSCCHTILLILSKFRIGDCEMRNGDFPFWLRASVREPSPTL